MHAYALRACVCACPLSAARGKIALIHQINSKLDKFARTGSRFDVTMGNTTRGDNSAKRRHQATAVSKPVENLVSSIINVQFMKG